MKTIEIIEHMLNCKLQLTSLAKNASFFGHTEYGGFARCSTSGAACSEFGSSFLQGKYRTYIVIEQTKKKADATDLTSWSLTLVDGRKQTLIESPSVLVGFSVIRECGYDRIGVSTAMFEA